MSKLTKEECLKPHVIRKISKVPPLKETKCRGIITFTFANDGVDIALCHVKEKDLITAFFRLGEIIRGN